MKQAVHRHTGNSKQGRRIAAQNSNRNIGVTTLTQEQKDWNTLVDAKKLEKQNAKS